MMAREERASMSAGVGDSTAMMADFVAGAAIGPDARERAALAFADTIGVMLAGRPRAGRADGAGDGGRGRHGHGAVPLCSVPRSAPARSWRRLRTVLPPTALDYDDMCFVSMAHPSCALVPAALAAGELAAARGSLLLDAYVAGFEIECRLGTVMNPRHYHQRGWHCTSSIGTLGAAAAAARVLGLDAARTRHALGIAASAACGLKENLGTMVKPLHAGLAARNGVMAARLAERGFTASPHALDGPQGYLAVMDSEGSSLDAATCDLGSRWEILETGISVKLYPSCAATHPPLDALFDLQRREGFNAAASRRSTWRWTP
jgi:2-methylcitrate dehydratase PrpD